MEIHGATEAQESRLELALDRFGAAGLELPRMSVVFHTDESECDDHAGLFRSGVTPVEIHICSERISTVYEHELAHAWAFYNLNDQQEQAMMALFGCETWNGQSFEWNERGSEVVATIIQQALSGLPLPPALSSKIRLRILAYRLLTGHTSPRYVEWLASSPYARSEPTHPSLIGQGEMQAA